MTAKASLPRTPNGCVLEPLFTLQSWFPTESLSRPVWVSQGLLLPGARRPPVLSVQRVHFTPRSHLCASCALPVRPASGDSHCSADGSGPLGSGWGVRPAARLSPSGSRYPAPLNQPLQSRGPGLALREAIGRRAPLLRPSLWSLHSHQVWHRLQREGAARPSPALPLVGPTPAPAPAQPLSDPTWRLRVPVPPPPTRCAPLLSPARPVRPSDLLPAQNPPLWDPR